MERRRLYLRLLAILGVALLVAILLYLTSDKNK